MRKMQPYFKLMITLVLLAMLVITGYWGKDSLLNSAVAYRSPLAGSALEQGLPLPVQTDQVVLVIISGLGDDPLVLKQMPTLTRLQESGAAATLTGMPPSYRQTTWATLLTGAWPEFNNALFIEGLNNAASTTAVETIVAAAQQAGVETVLGGQSNWQDILPVEMLTRMVLTQQADIQGDQQVLDGVLPVLEADGRRLTVIQFNQLAYTVEDSGNYAGEAYQQAAAQVDLLLAQLLSRLDLNRTTLMITGDYAYTEMGNHGGDDLPVLQHPLVMIGNRVIPGNYSSIMQVDTAPTIAALLGTALPVANQGMPHLEMIQISEADIALVSYHLAQQQLSRANAYLATLGAAFLPGDDLANVQTFLKQGNNTGAYQLSQLVIKQIGEAVTAARRHEESRGQWLRLLVIGITVLLMARWWAVTHTELWFESVFCGAVIVAVYHGLYRLAELPYSLSAIVTLDQTWADAGRRMMVSVLVGAMLFVGLLVLRQYRQFWGVLQGWYDLLLLATLGFASVVGYGFWQIGGTITRFAPDVTVFFYYFTGLCQLYWVVVTGIFMPLLVIPLNSALQAAILLYRQQQNKEVQR